MELAPDFDEFIGSLIAHGVEFVVVGAYALAGGTPICSIRWRSAIAAGLSSLMGNPKASVNLTGDALSERFADALGDALTTALAQDGALHARRDRRLTSACPLCRLHGGTPAWHDHGRGGTDDDAGLHGGGEVAAVTNARGETTTYAYDGGGSADERDGTGGWSGRRLCYK
jgi:hypothetical protein